MDHPRHEELSQRRASPLPPDSLPPEPLPSDPTPPERGGDDASEQRPERTELSPEQLRTKRIFTTGEAAAVCKVSQQTIIRCFDSGRLTGFRVPGSKFRRIPREELIRFMRANNIPLTVLEGGRQRVLVVDDDKAILDLFVDLLTRDGRFDVKTASNGYDAGMLTESFSPNLVVLDYMLPDLNGDHVCRRIRAKPETRDTRILCVSGVVNPAEVKGLLEAGADDFLKKPFDVHVLMGKIEALLGLTAGPGAGSRPTPPGGQGRTA